MCIRDSGYTMLMHLPELGDAGILETVFRDWLTKIPEDKGAVERPPSISRIQTAGVYQPKRYDACVHITQGNRPAPGKHIAGCIDGETHFQAILEKDSILHLRGLADGPHTISIDGGDEVLVNNYSGAGLAKDGIAVSVTLKKDVYKRQEKRSVSTATGSMPDTITATYQPA